MFSIARHYFENDMRFCIGPKPDIARKDELLYLYISDMCDPEADYGKALCTCLICEGSIIGFNLWKNEGNSRARIYLSALKPEIKNVGLSYHLYSHTLSAMAGKGITYLSEWVSTSNTKSLNVHNKLFNGNFKYIGYNDTWVWGLY